MALTTIELQVTEGTLSEHINNAYNDNGIKSNMLIDLTVINDNGVNRILITYDTDL